MGFTGFQNNAAIRRPRSVTLSAALLTLALVLGATAAPAADSCYRGVGGTVLVFKKFKLPRAGECSPISGFQQDSNRILTGAACGTSDGFLVHFNFNQYLPLQPFGGCLLLQHRPLDPAGRRLVLPAEHEHGPVLVPDLHRLQGHLSNRPELRGVIRTCDKELPRAVSDTSSSSTRGSSFPTRPHRREAVSRPFVAAGGTVRIWTGGPWPPGC